MQSNKIFSRVGSLKPNRSRFNLSYSKLFNCDMGQLIPVMMDEVIPGDVFNISNEIVIRMQPLVAPILHEINCYVHYFFVPYRIIWDSWEDFITGGEDGEDASVIPKVEQSDFDPFTKFSLWDYFGFPTFDNDTTTVFPIDFPWRCYNLIWNEWYRDQTHQTEVTIDDQWSVLYRNWEKDIFTTALPWQQRGTAPAFPISGTTSAVWSSSIVDGSPAGGTTVQADGDTASDDKIWVGTQIGETNFKNALNDNAVDLGVAETFDITDIRLGFQIQKWLERNARAGGRYIEYLQAHFGVYPRDERLQRPEWIGGTKQPVIISEVLQNSESGSTPQGTMAGHGLTASGNYVGKYHAKEFGLIMGLMSIMPRASYSQGLSRQWIKSSRYDFYSPEFANLSEQAIIRAEIYYENYTTDDDVWGYTGRYNELRSKQDMYCADMRDTFDYWHLGRIFASTPDLDEDFIKCVPDTRIFAVETEPGFIVHHQNIIEAFRPIPISAEPGLVDHM